MRVLEKLQEVGQSLWLGHLSRELIRDGSLMNYIEERSITGLYFSPQAFRQTLAASSAYDSTITRKLSEGFYGESLVYSLIYEDVRYAADLLRVVYDRTDGVDGWSVIPVSPLSSVDNETLVSKLQDIHRQVQRSNVLLCLPALPDRLEIIEELVFGGVPINIANIYSDKQYREVSNACLRGIERRIESGLKSVVSTLITINVARLETAFSQQTDRQAATDLAVATARKIYGTLREMNNSQQWGRLFNMGVRPLRLIWTYSGGTRMVDVNCALYSRLMAPYTVVALPDTSLEEYVAQPAPENPIPIDGGDCEQVLAGCSQLGIDVEIEADQLQADYINWMSNEWAMLLESIARRSAELTQKVAQL